MHRRTATLALIAIIFAAVMVLPALSVWVFVIAAGIGEIWSLLVAGVLFIALIAAVVFILPRFLGRR